MVSKTCVRLSRDSIIAGGTEDCARAPADHTRVSDSKDASGNREWCLRIVIKITGFSGELAEPGIKFQVRCSLSFWHRPEGCLQLQVQRACSVRKSCTYQRKSVPRNPWRESV